MSTLLAPLGLFLGLLHIIADYRHAWRLTYVLKPLTMVCFVLIAALVVPADAVYRNGVVAALLLSLAGDIMLMLRPARFVAGLIFFLLAHLLYIASFFRLADGLWWPGLLVPALAGLVMARVLWTPSGGLRPAVLAYIATIVLMVASAASAWWSAQASGQLVSGELISGYLMILLGAALFMVSDAVLGYARFRQRFSSAQALILGTYYPAQCLLAVSVGLIPPMTQNTIL
ncbi:MAG: lysoplasmalogenase [Gammaproteobacteria bacterium]